MKELGCCLGQCYSGNLTGPAGQCGELQLGQAAAYAAARSPAEGETGPGLAVPRVGAAGPGSVPPAVQSALLHSLWSHLSGSMVPGWGNMVGSRPMA